MRYVQKSLAEGQAEGLTPPDGVSDWDEYLNYCDDPDWEQAIWLVHEDGTSKYISGDGGEPEDNTLNRDWCWIVDELNRAFRAGFIRGYNDGYGSLQTDEGLPPQ